MPSQSMDWESSLIAVFSESAYYLYPILSFLVEG
jgi:hypothetical protein